MAHSRNNAFLPHLFIAIAIAALLVLLVAFSLFRKDSVKEDPEAVERIRPVAIFRSAPATPPPAAEPVAAEGASTPDAEATDAAAAEATPPAARDGATVYAEVCKTCHETGVTGAPKKGDKGDWEPRIAQGVETLYASALQGKGAMPPKGTAVRFSDEEVKGAVDYMVELAR
ncbi:MAG: c-type cytochrome [Zoogloeaceae bacterium]|jgi:cytochrome c5|nr:c-type cytochrome [Zoogloeaceae bacterium]